MSQFQTTQNMSFMSSCETEIICFGCLKLSLKKLYLFHPEKIEVSSKFTFFKYGLILKLLFLRVNLPRKK